ncbi:Acyltransferase family protein [Streptosporangium subroseum]|uniref:Acyltransferase family protein n=1 Tax=Streptosporangium subroseum TaxID=106412 RepID=A0A239DGS4_9ACTN|nr:acyltransferase [Streptosporangium subroseum]SNS31529.1 Acyltransferase family protein [Streptosporangium subroseum]
MTAVISRPAVRTAPASPGRDPFIDVLRVFGMALVVLQHWSMPVLSFAEGRIVTGNALATGNAWMITWISQVMPLVFFAGGAANAISWRGSVWRGGTPPAWMAVRLRRLAWPVLPLAAVWLPLPHLLLRLGMPEQPVETASRLAGQLLWFLAVYLVAVAMTPLMLRLNMRYGWRVPAVLAVAAVAVDAARFGTGLEVIGFLNIGLVWLAVHQLGFLYADGRLGRPWIMALTGYGLAAALVAFGPYPGSMIGMPGAAVSNMAPPTVALLAVGFGQIGLALALRGPIVAFARWPGVSRVLGWAGRRMMTVYLWHMSALFVITSVVVVGLGVSTPEPGTSAWLSGWPHWLLMLALAMWPLLRSFARFEEPPAASPYTGGMVRIMVAAALVGVGLLTFTVIGFVPGPAPVFGAGAILVGLVLTWSAPAPRPGTSEAVTSSGGPRRALD